MTKNKAKKKGIVTILDYLDDFIEREKIRTGNYPTKLQLTQEAIDKAKDELKQYDLELSWADDFPSNYRGIPIERIEK